MLPINDTVIIESIKEDKTFAGGLNLSEQYDEDNRYIKAKVIAASEKTLVKADDLVYFDKRAGHSIDYKGSLYTVIKERDIIMLDRDDEGAVLQS